MTELRGSTREGAARAVGRGDAQMEDESTRRGDHHRECAQRPRLPAGLQRKELVVADEHSLEDQAQDTHAVPEHEQRGDEHDDLQVRAAQRGTTLLRRASRRTIRGPVMQVPRGHGDKQQRDGEAGLLAVLLPRPVELREHERQSGETAARRIERDLGADTEEIRDSQHDHVDRDQAARRRGTRAAPPAMGVPRRS